MKRKEAGFFLLETIFLGMIVAVLAIVCYSYVFLNQQRRYAELAVTASFLSQKQIALTEALPAEQLQTAAEIPWLGGGGYPIERNGQTFWLTTRVTDTAYSTKIRAVEVTISWEEQGRRNEQKYRKLVIVHD